MTLGIATSAVRATLATATSGDGRRGGDLPATADDLFDNGDGVGRLSGAARQARAGRRALREAGPRNDGGARAVRLEAATAGPRRAYAGTGIVGALSGRGGLAPLLTVVADDDAPVATAAATQEAPARDERPATPGAGALAAETAAAATRSRRIDALEGVQGIGVAA